MDLYNVKAGKSKERLKILMTDKLNKAENYKKALEKSKVGKWATAYRHIVIEKAEPGADIKDNRKTNMWTNYNKPGPRRIK